MADAVKRLRLRYPSTCASCGINLSPGAEALWDRSTKQASCLACSAGGATVAQSVAGASAASEGDRRKAKRVEEARRKYGDHAAVVAEHVAGREVAATWGKGSSGESRLAAFIERKLGDSVIALHDRLIPGTKSNIDHIYVAPSGVWVVDAKSYKGKVEKRDVGPLWRTEYHVYVGGRNRTALADGVKKQVACVVAALTPDNALKGTQVHAALCFVDSEWGLLDFPFSVKQSVWVLYPGALRKRLAKDGPLSRETMERIARRLDLSLPPASD